MDSRLSKKHLIYIWTPFELTLKKVIVIFNRNVRFQILVSDNNLFTIFKSCLTTIMVFFNHYYNVVTLSPKAVTTCIYFPLWHFTGNHQMTPNLEGEDLSFLSKEIILEGLSAKLLNVHVKCWLGEMTSGLTFGHVKTQTADCRLCRLGIFFLINFSYYFSVSFTLVFWRCVYIYFFLFAMPIDS